MRTFISIEISSVEPYLKEIQNKIKLGGLRLVNDFHLTLHFLGDINEKKVEKIKESLKELKFEPFKIKLDKASYFPETGDIRVIWVGLKPEDKIKKLQKQVDELAGLKRDEKFKPHITLARVKFIKHKRELKDKINNMKIENKSFMVEKIKLMKSELTPTGPVYETLV